jgi:hypothetical protein
MIRTLCGDPRASHGSTLWCIQPRQLPRSSNLARRVPHRLHRLPAAKSLLRQGFPKPEAHRQRPAGHPRGQVRLICSGAPVPALPSPPLPQSQAPPAPVRHLDRHLPPGFRCVESPSGAAKRTTRLDTRRSGARSAQEWGYLAPPRALSGWAADAEQRALTRSRHPTPARTPGLPGAASVMGPGRLDPWESRWLFEPSSRVSTRRFCRSPMPFVTPSFTQTNSPPPRRVGRQRRHRQASRQRIQHPPPLLLSRRDHRSKPLADAVHRALFEPPAHSVQPEHRPGARAHKGRRCVSPRSAWGRPPHLRVASSRQSVFVPNEVQRQG